MKVTRVLGSLALGLSLCAAAYAKDMIDNPEYGYWKDFGKGSFVTMEMTASGNKTSTTTTLTEISPEKATIESKMSMMVNGKPMDMPANKRDIAAKVEKPEQKGNAPAAEKPKEGDEEIELGGKKVKAHYMIVGDNKMWYSNEIPGHMAKMEGKSFSQVAIKWEKK